MPIKNRTYKLYLIIFALTIFFVSVKSTKAAIRCMGSGTVNETDDTCTFKWWLGISTCNYNSSSSSDNCSWRDGSCVHQDNWVLSRCTQFAGGCVVDPGPKTYSSSGCWTCNDANWGACDAPCGGGTQWNDCGGSRSCNTHSCCSCTSWTDQGCNVSGCGYEEMYQTRSCDPDGCSNETRCTSHDSCAVDCSIDLTPNDRPITDGDDILFLTTVLSEQRGVVDRITFSSSDTTLATVDPANDDTSLYQSTASTGALGGLGTVTITAEARMFANGSNAGYRCSDSTVLDIVPPPPTCTIDIKDNYLITAGSSASVIPVITMSHPTYSIDNVEFEIGNTGIATVCESGIGYCPLGSPAIYIDDAIVFRANVSGVAPGNTTIVATATMTEGPSCFDLGFVSTADTASWWQVINGDAVTNGDVISLIPNTCALFGGCDPYLITGEAAGLASHGVGTVFDFDTGSVSTLNFLAEANYTNEPPISESVLEARVTDTIESNWTVTPATILFNYFHNEIASGAAYQEGGYYWFYHNGDISIDAWQTISNNKVIMIVDEGDVSINGQIHLTDGQGFFLLVAGKDAGGGKGNISIDSPFVAAGVDEPEIEGLYFAEGTFSTGAFNEQFRTRGSIVGMDGINMERDLDNDTVTPAEIFEYGADQILHFPRLLGKERIRWTEVAP